MNDLRGLFADPNAGTGYKDRQDYEEAMMKALEQAHKGQAKRLFELSAEVTNGTTVAPNPLNVTPDDATLSEENLVSFVEAFMDGEVSMIEATETVNLIVSELLSLREGDRRSGRVPTWSTPRTKLKPILPDDPFALLFAVALKRMGGKMEITDAERAGWILDEEIEGGRHPNGYLTEYRLVKKKKP